MTLKRTRLKSSLPKQATFTVRRRDSAHPAEGDASAATPSAASASAESALRHPSERTTTTKRRLQRHSTPLEILQQPILYASRKVFDLRRFLVVLGLTGLVLMLPTPAGLSVMGHRALALLVFTGSILALEPAPLPISALLIPVAQVALGINTVTGAFSSFGKPNAFLVLSSLFLAEALRKHGLTRRLALNAIVLSGGSVFPLLLSLMTMTALLSMWVQNTATTAVLIPVAITIAQRFPGRDTINKILPVLILTVVYGANLGGMSTIVGSGENAIASGALTQVMPFGFFDWMKFALPLLVLLLPMSWFLILRTNDIPATRLDTAEIRGEIDRSGPLSSAEKEIIIVMAVAVILWVAGAAVENALNLPPTLLSSVMVAIGAVAYLSFSGIIDWNDMKGVNWGIFLVVGAGLSLSTAMDETGASAWIAQMAEPLLSALPYAATLFAILVATLFTTQVLNSITLGAILSPLLVAIAQGSGISPVRLVIPPIITLAFCYMLPGSSTRNAMMALTGAVDRKRMMRTGLVVGVPSMLVVYFFFLILSLVGVI